jgi:hypothetical protein
MPAKQGWYKNLMEKNYVKCLAQNLTHSDYLTKRRFLHQGETQIIHTQLIGSLKWPVSQAVIQALNLTLVREKDNCHFLM